MSRLFQVQISRMKRGINYPVPHKSWSLRKNENLTKKIFTLSKRLIVKPILN